MNKMKIFFQLFRFGVVGLSAALVHFFVVVLLVQFDGLHPLIANIFGFSISFPLSYFGHKQWTFNARTTEHHVAIPKLLFVQLLNFAANETLYYIFLSLGIPYALALPIVIVVLPLFTFLSSKLWVFR